MRSISFTILLGVLFLASLVASASAQGYPPETIIVAAPTIVGNQITGVIALVYPDGSNVTLDPPRMTVRLCGAKGCTTVDVSVNKDGSFSIPITADMAGTYTLYIVANSMKDIYGMTFPAVDTAIGEVTIPSSSPSSAGLPPGTPQKPHLFRIAQSALTQETMNPTLSTYSIATLLISLVAVGAIVVAPRRTKT